MVLDTAMNVNTLSHTDTTLPPIAVITWNDYTEECKNLAITKINEGHLLHLKFHTWFLSPQMISQHFQNVTDKIHFCEFSGNDFTSTTILKVVSSFSALAGLSLSRCHIDNTDEFITFIKNHTGITHLHLENCTFSHKDGPDRIIQAIAAFLPNIKSLSLSTKENDRVFNEKHIHQILESTTSLEKLDLRGCPFRNQASNILTKHTDLTSLALSSPALTVTALANIIIHCQSLTRLHVGGEQISFADIVELSSYMSALEELTVEASCMRNSASFSELASSILSDNLRFKGLKHLHLQIDASSLTEKHIELLVALYEKHPDISITLNGEALAAELLRKIKFVTSPQELWPQLERVCLSGPFPLEEAFLSLIIKKLKKVEHLSFNGCFPHITDDTLTTLTEAYPNYTPGALQSLDFSGCIKLTDQALSELLNALTPITSIDLSGCNVGTKTLTALATRHAASLESINLQKCSTLSLDNIKDFLVQRWQTDATLRRKQLKTLYVDSHIKGIDDSLIYFFIGHGAHITTLHLGDATISDEALITLYRERPTLRVEHETRTKEALHRLKQEAEKKRALMETSNAPQNDNNAPDTTSEEIAVIEWDGTDESIKKLEAATAHNQAIHLRFTPNAMSVQELISVFPLAWRAHVISCEYEGVTFTSIEKDNIISGLETFPALTSFTFSKCVIEEIAPIIHMLSSHVKEHTDDKEATEPRPITHLDFHECIFFEGQAFEPILNSINKQHMQSLRLDNNQRQDTSNNYPYDLPGHILLSLLADLPALQELHMLGQDFSEEAITLLVKNHPALKALSFSSWNLTEAQHYITAIGDIGLEQLHLVGKGITYQNMVDFSHRLTGLKKLTVGASCFSVCQAFFKSPDEKGFEHLEHIDFKAIPENEDRTSLFLAIYEKYPDISLTIDGLPLSPSELNPIILATGSHDLWEAAKQVHLDGALHVMDNTLIRHILIKLKAVEYLSFTGQKTVNDTTLEILLDTAKAYAAGALHSLDFSGCTALTDKGIKDFIHQTTHALQSINLSGCAITLETMATLASTQRHSTLHTVNIQDCSHEAHQGLRFIFSSCKELKNISFGPRTLKSTSPTSNDLRRMNDAIIERIIKDCKHLTHLNIGGAHVSDKALIALFTAFPHVAFECLTRTPEALTALKIKAGLASTNVNNVTPLAGHSLTYAQKLCEEAFLTPIQEIIKTKAVPIVEAQLKKVLEALPKTDIQNIPLYLHQRFLKKVQKHLAPHLLSKKAESIFANENTKEMRQLELSLSHALNHHLSHAIRNIAWVPTVPCTWESLQEYALTVCTEALISGERTNHITRTVGQKIQKALDTLPRPIGEIVPPLLHQKLLEKTRKCLAPHIMKEEFIEALQAKSGTAKEFQKELYSVVQEYVRETTSQSHQKAGKHSTNTYNAGERHFG